MSNSVFIHANPTERCNIMGIRFGVVRVVAVALMMLASLDADAIIRFPARIPRVPRAPTRVPHAPGIPAGLIDWERRNIPRGPNQTPNGKDKDESVRGRVLIRTNEYFRTQYEQLQFGQIYNPNCNIEVAEKYVCFLDNSNMSSHISAETHQTLWLANREGRYSANSDGDGSFNDVFAGCHQWGGVGKFAVVILFIGCGYLVFKCGVLKVFRFLGNVHAKLTFCIWR